LKNNDYEWKQEFSFGDYESGKHTEINDDVLKDSFEALTRLYQKETRRSKTGKQRRDCWQ